MPPSTESRLISILPANGTSPIALSRKIGWAKNTFLLDGSKGEGWFDGRFSLLGGAPFGIFQSKNRLNHFYCLISGKEETILSTEAPLIALQNWFDRFQMKTFSNEKSPKIPFAFGGVVGFFSYELAYQFESILSVAVESALPDIYLLFLNFYIILDHRKDLIYLIYNTAPEVQMGKERKAAYQDGHKKIESLQKRITGSESPSLSVSNSVSKKAPYKTKRATIEAKTDCSSDAYIKMVRRAQDYIAAGDIFQANLSHEFTAPAHFSSLFDIYQRLWEINPSPFASYLDLGEIQIASGSPERLVRTIKCPEGNRVETRPIAGTRPRGRTPIQDKTLIEALYLSEKERAEHLMLIDLERNDLGKICQYGSVSVDSLMALETYSHVFHLVSNISGALIPDTSPLEVLKALFPGGTITGVPKIRCMEIIAELEAKARGVYTGSIGYIGFDGEMDLNIAIRTWVRQKGVMMFRVGAGIVADSDPQSEYQETLQKAAALMEALRPA